MGRRRRPAVMEEPANASQPNCATVACICGFFHHGVGVLCTPTVERPTVCFASVPSFLL